MTQAAHAELDRRGTRELDRFRRFAAILDRRYLDPILSLLFPGAGSVLGAVLGLYGVVVAFRLRAHPIVIARMLTNLAVDALIGMVPIAGAVGDFFFRANLRNAALLNARTERPLHSSDFFVVGAALFAFALALLLPLILVAWLVSLIAGLF